MILKLLVLTLGITASTLAATVPADSVYSPLRLYSGSWTVTRNPALPGTKPDSLKNQCASVGQFFACQQIVNSQPGAMIIFIPTSKSGHYYTQNITLQGQATSRGDLDIAGDRWTYSSTWDAGGSTTYYRNINVFSGKNHIHFEQSESKNGRDWTVKMSGDEQRNSGASQ